LSARLAVIRACGWAMAFNDKFSGVARAYADQRPHYPEVLYDWLSSGTQSHNLCWDCATGNGQAAVALASRYARVIATDASAQMIEAAQSHDRVRYIVRAAESVPEIDDSSVDLVTVAQAIHWFDLDRFYREVKRVLKPGGLIAVWAYAGSHVTDEIDAVTKRLNHEILDGYWADNVELVNREYRYLPFPFKEIETPEFHMEVSWTLAGFLTYHKTWSAAQDYLRATGIDAVDLIAGEIASLWGNASEPRTVSWKLSRRVGTNL